MPPIYYGRRRGVKSRSRPPKPASAGGGAPGTCSRDGIGLEPNTAHFPIDALRPAFLSVKQFAVLVGLSENTVLRRIKDQQIRATRIGRLWRIPVSEVGRLLG
jgi:excisionase family DNA binding protein